MYLMHSKYNVFLANVPQWSHYFSKVLSFLLLQAFADDEYEINACICFLSQQYLDKVMII